METARPASRCRVVLSQVIACLALDLLLIDLGMATSFVTIVLPEVLNAKEGLSITEKQASWFASMAYLCQPLGSVFSGPILDYFGRKKAIFISNVPHVAAWLLLAYCWDVPSLFIANAMLGIGTGVMEAPSVTYVGEVSDNSIRGILTTLSTAFTSSGGFLAYFLGSFLPWRTAALLAIVVPLSSMLTSLLVPETPIWLISKGHQKDSLKSLRHLRGWVKPEIVKDEFDDLLKYNEFLQQCFICVKTDRNPSECPHKNGSIMKYKLLKIRHVMLSKETMRPFLLVMAYFFFHAMSGMQAVRPNMVNVCKALGMAYDPQRLLVWVGALGLLMSVVSAVAVKIIGKRKLILFTMLGTACCSLGLSLYAKAHVPIEVFSYDPTTFSARKSMVPLALFIAMVCFTNLGIPWVILSEVFPFRSRGVATGMAAALNYGIIFIAVKTNYNLESAVNVSGSFAVYAFFGFLGVVFLYLFLPETENKSLLEIEDFYRGDFRIFANDFFINMFWKPNKVRNEADRPMLVIR